MRSYNKEEVGDVKKPIYSEHSQNAQVSLDEKENNFLWGKKEREELSAQNVREHMMREESQSIGFLKL